MRIPEIADRLRELAPALACPELEELADELRRRPSTRVAGPRSRKMTPALAAEIRAAVAARPGATQVEIARLFNVNPGRVSEAVNGKRQ